MGNFEKDVQTTLGFEGGISDRPLSEDPGGLTNLGISQRFLNAIGDRRSPRDLTVRDAVELYRRHFWDPIAGDKLPEPLAVAVFDHGVNCGTGTAAKILQALLNTYLPEGSEIAEDGGLGPGTLAALEVVLAKIQAKLQTLPPERLAALWFANAFLWERVNDYSTRPSASLRSINLSGWIRRVYSLEDKVLHAEED